MLQQGTSRSLDWEEGGRTRGQLIMHNNFWKKKDFFGKRSSLCSFYLLCFPHNMKWFISRVVCFQLECFPRLREETERIVTSHIRDRESRAKDQVSLVKLYLWTRTLVFKETSGACIHTYAYKTNADIFSHIKICIPFYCNITELQKYLFYILYHIIYSYIHP